MKDAALLDNRQNRIRCFVVTHMPKTKGKKRLVVSSLPSLLSTDLQCNKSEYEEEFE